MTEQLDFNIKTIGNWRPNNIVRRKTDGHPYLIIQIVPYICIFVVDLQEKQTPIYPQVILGRNFDEFTADTNMVIKQKHDKIEFNYQPLTL